MKPQEVKDEFIQLRAEGLSYDRIAERLHISKSTCTAWEREFKARIDQLKRERLVELYQAYGMAKEGRIRRLGETINRIGSALEEADLSATAPDKLLKLYLDYCKALREEYTAPAEALSLKVNHDPATVLSAIGDLFDRIRAGEISPEQAGLEGRTLTNMLTAYEALQTKERIDALDAIVGGR